ncbi:hypothetical protein GCM10009798_42480 [Nocardioides panacihumi]|uniref:DUF2510 domain-containing protein n=1 Tax=Nocardioides panacihumi TaxID=400774 RepID=A0ABN2RYV0_9ACTN
MTDAPLPAAQAGWYQDPHGPSQRYWDGYQWTSHVQAPAPFGGGGGPGHRRDCPLGDDGPDRATDRRVQLPIALLAATGAARHLIDENGLARRDVHIGIAPIDGRVCEGRCGVQEARAVMVTNEPIGLVTLTDGGGGP